MASQKGMDLSHPHLPLAKRHTDIHSSFLLRALWLPVTLGSHLGLQFEARKQKYPKYMESVNAMI